MIGSAAVAASVTAVDSVFGGAVGAGVVANDGADSTAGASGGAGSGKAGRSRAASDSAPLQATNKTQARQARTIDSLRTMGFWPRICVVRGTAQGRTTDVGKAIKLSDPERPDQPPRSRPGIPRNRWIEGKIDDSLAELDSADVNKVVGLKPNPAGPPDLWQSIASGRDSMDEIQGQKAALNPTRNTWVTKPVQ